MSTSTLRANLDEALDITGAPAGEVGETRGVIAKYINGEDGDVVVAWTRYGACQDCSLGIEGWVGFPRLVRFNGDWETTDQCGSCGSRWGAHADYVTGDDSVEDLIESIKAVTPKRYLAAG